jgi:glycosyltransferase involved in cell wall biosynthesis
MRIGYFIPLIACKKGFGNNVSGHVQVPMRAMQLLADAGHDVHLMTNAPTEDRPDLPVVLPRNITVHYVEDGRKRKKVVDGVGGAKKGVRPGAFIKQIRQIKQIIRDNDLAVFHAWGYGRVADFAGLLGIAGVRVPRIVTLFDASSPRGLPGRMLRRTWGGLTIVTATEHVAAAFRRQGLDVTIVRHGPVRDLLAEMNGQPVEPASRVLFWRDPSTQNGADTCRDAFDVLAPRFPDATFEMAVRPHWKEVEGIAELEARHDNVTIHRFPYPEGFSLAALVAGSLCVPMLFRDHSIHPQLVIAETLAAGVPVISSDLGSGPELVEDGETGLIVPVGDVEATIAAIDRMLSDEPAARAMGVRAAESMAADWSWTNFTDDIIAVYDRALGGTS